MIEVTLPVDTLSESPALHWCFSPYAPELVTQRVTESLPSGAVNGKVLTLRLLPLILLLLALFV